MKTHDLALRCSLKRVEKIRLSVYCPSRKEKRIYKIQISEGDIRMERFCKAILIYGLIVTGIISLLLIGLGVLLILDSSLVLQIVIWGFASICILLGAAGIFSILIGALRSLT